MKFILISLIIGLVLFLFCACKISSQCSRIEEMEELENDFRKRI